MTGVERLAARADKLLKRGSHDFQRVAQYTVMLELRRENAALAARVRELEQDCDKAREFFRRCWWGNLEGIEPDGGEFQDWGEELGLLTKIRREQPCGENCNCEELGADFPTDCYVLTHPVVPTRKDV